MSTNVSVNKSQLSMNRRQFALGALACSGLALGGRFAAASEPAGTEASGDVKVVEDMLGVEVSVPTQITNLFNAYPVNVGVMTMLGVSDSMRYVLPRVQSGKWAWLCEINPALMDLDAIGDDGKVSAEELMTIEPEVVVVNSKATAEEYRNAGLNVFAVTSSTADDFLTAVEKTAELFDADAQQRAADFVELYRANVEFVAERVKDLAEEDRKSVYYVCGSTPYDTAVAGRGVEFVTNSGASFAVEVEEGDGKTVTATAEAILAGDPDVVIVGNNTRAAAYEALMADEALASLRAVQEGEVYLTPQGVCPWDVFGPEQALMPLWMGKTLYPELFEDVDLEQEVRDFYLEFFGYEVSDAYLAQMLAGDVKPVDEEQASETDGE
jgi:iron complex transport system substrate-binding protein